MQIAFKFTVSWDFCVTTFYITAYMWTLWRTLTDWLRKRGEVGGGEWGQQAQAVETIPRQPVPFATWSIYDIITLWLKYTLYFFWPPYHKQAFANSYFIGESVLSLRLGYFRDSAQLGSALSGIALSKTPRCPVAYVSLSYFLWVIIFYWGQGHNIILYCIVEVPW